MVEIAPSILSADFSDLKKAVSFAEKANSRYLHLDVMDGHFVPNITFGPMVVSALRKITDLILDAHLMIEHPEKYVDAFIAAGADIVTVHYEATNHLDRLISYIKSKGVKAGVAINPATPEKALEYIIEKADLVLIMSVNPGFGGQKFIPEVLNKFFWLRERNPGVLLEIDGGINPDTAAQAAAAGAEILVAGSAVYGTNNPVKSIEELLKAANSK
jgi:ribulose-phosphate 3-epimerase